MADTTLPVVAEAAQATPPNADTNFSPVAFNGNAKEYFGIWISNLFLSIITLGIYSAWAKVRRLKYFYNNTEIDNFSFNYHATGKQLLKGRLLAIAIFLAYSFLTSIYPITAIFFSIAFIFGMPWVLNRSLRFSARMTSWRNVRLNWHGTYWESFFYFIVTPSISLISLGLLVPLVSQNYYRYYTENHSFGTTRFKCSTRTSQYYKAFAIGAVIPAIIGIALAVIATVAISASLASEVDFSTGSIGEPQPMRPLNMILAVAPALLFYVANVIYTAMCRNILLRELTLGEAAAFDSGIKPLKWLWIELSNGFCMLFSLGLLLPWAMVRRYRYLAAHTGISLSASANTFIDEHVEATGAFGEEFADLDGFDVGI